MGCNSRALPQVVPLWTSLIHPLRPLLPRRRSGERNCLLRSSSLRLRVVQLIRSDAGNFTLGEVPSCERRIRNQDACCCFGVLAADSFRLSKCICSLRATLRESGSRLATVVLCLLQNLFAGTLSEVWLAEEVQLKTARKIQASVAQDREHCGRGEEGDILHY